MRSCFLYLKAVGRWKKCDSCVLSPVPREEIGYQVRGCCLVWCARHCSLLSAFPSGLASHCIAAVAEWLASLRLSKYEAGLRELGATTLEDMKYVGEADLHSLGMLKVERKRFVLDAWWR